MTRISQECWALKNRGEVTEWPNVRDWKSRVGESLPGVRIPPSPYVLLSPEKNKTKFYIFNKYKPCVNQKVKGPTHASAFCIKFKEKCDDMKIPCETIFVKDDWNASIENMKKNL